MKRARSHGNDLSFALGLILSVFLVALTCPPVADASCSTLEPMHDGWLKSSNVKYSLTGFTSAEQTQLNNALLDWSWHNLTLNCSDVYFSSTIGGSVKLSISSTLSAEPSDPTAAATTVSSVNGVGVVIAAATVFWFGGAGWVRNGSVTYYECVRKIMIHEVGHSMGIDHPSTPVAGNTVRITVMGSTTV